MERTKINRLLLENMKSIFGFSLTRLGNVADAEDLAGDILLAVLKSAENLQDESRFYGFLWKIAENTYVQYLRRRARQAKHTATLSGDVEDIEDVGETALDGLIEREERNLLRRELTLLSRQYRDTTVL